MKILSFCPLFYGKEYLDAAIKAVEPVSDKIIILYTDKPSYGHNSTVVCPESEHELREIALNASPKVEWIKVSANGEGEHRNIIYQYTDGYDLLVCFDSDEVWSLSSLVDACAQAYKGTAHRYNILGFKHFWKSFNHICQDSFAPARIYNLNNHNTQEQTLRGTIYHFGYAQSNEIMRYKWEIHGHKDEIRPNWFNEIYLGWKDGNKDLHPTSHGVWLQADSFDKNELPLKEHSNFNKEVIE